ncbi:hypothetical protein [Kitasatospora cheerisanensis]|uniref:hypothetical protein n=1 Tax=Kitasatospora cheerisanensis TaxID=81942 RepID=UPI0005653599|nr:hypothetical protein [Kitasatospora cheerisanensis]
MSPAAAHLPAPAHLPVPGQLPSAGPLSELLARTPAPPPHPHVDALRAELTHWLAGTGVLDAAGTARFLDRGHLELAARCWGDVPAGPGLRTAAKWLVLTRILDEHVDDRWTGDPTGAARHTIGALHSLFTGGASASASASAAAPGEGPRWCGRSRSSAGKPRRSPDPTGRPATTPTSAATWTVRSRS